MMVHDLADQRKVRAKCCEGRACSQPSGKAYELEAPVPEKAGGILFESLSEDPSDFQSPLVNKETISFHLYRSLWRNNMGALSIKKSWRRAELKIRGLKDVLHLNSDIPNSLWSALAHWQPCQLHWEYWTILMRGNQPSWRQNDIW